MNTEMIEKLREHGIQPSAQRVAVAFYVLQTDTHPSADQVWNTVRQTFPTLSRATVYNTLNLFVQKGLLRQSMLTEGRVVFDPNVERHHHFIDDETGDIYDIPWHALEVSHLNTLKEFDVREYQVLIRGRRANR